MRIEQRCAVELLRARMVLVGGLLQRSPAFGPSWPHWYGDGSVGRCSAEAEFHILQLAAALRFAQREMFVRHVRWLRVVLTHRGLSDKAILLSLGALVDLMQGCLPAEHVAVATEYVRAALVTYHVEPDPAPEVTDPLQRECLRALSDDDDRALTRLLERAAQPGLDADAYSQSVLVPVLHEVGRLWQVNAISVEQEHRCTARAARLLESLPLQGPVADGSGPVAVCSCIVGEEHELGIRMVAGALRRAGWTVACPDGRQEPSGLLGAIIGTGANLVAISATMLQHLHALESVIAAVRALPECARVLVLVGGQAFEAHPQLWKEVGADGMATDARQAVRVAQGLLQVGSASPG